MTVLNQADRVYLGAQLADAVYAGPNRVWSAVPALPPMEIPNLQAWFDATTLTPGLVSSWVDRSPSGLVAAQPMNTAAPTAGPAPDDQPAVLFAAAQTWLDIDGLGTMLEGRSAYTMIARVWPVDLTDWPIVLTAPFNSSAWQWIMEGAPGGGIYWGVGAQQYRLFEPGPPPGQWWTVTYVQGGESLAYINSRELITQQYGPGGDLLPTVPPLGPTVRMGAYYDGTFGWAGYISDILYYDRTLTDTERLTVENYLAGR